MGQSKVRLVLVGVTVLIAVALTLGMWVSERVPLNYFTVLMHAVSIYIGVGAGVLVAEWNRRRATHPNRDA